MATYSHTNTTLTAEQLARCNGDDYDSFHTRFMAELHRDLAFQLDALDITENDPILTMDTHAAERAYLHIQHPSHLTAYVEILQRTCYNIDANMYWTWVVYDLYTEYTIVSVDELLEVLDACTRTFTWSLIITKHTITDSDRDVLVALYTDMVKKARDRKVEEVCSSWILEEYVYENVVQWMPLELVEQLVYSVMKC